MRKPFRQVISSIHKIDDNELPNLKRRIDIASALVLLLIAIIVFRLWFLQIHKGAYYKKLSENNRIRVQNLAAPRGNIIDCKGRTLITSRPSFNLLWTKEDAPDPDAVLKKVSSILDTDISQLLDRIRQAAGHPRYMPVRLAEDIGWSNLVRIENHQYELPGISIESVPTRQYMYGDAASHLMGYLGEINDQELAAHPDGDYRAGDLFGKRGIEKLYENYLHGEKGFRYLEVDARGFEQKELEVQDSLAGNDLVLTLDVDLQQAAEKALADKAGSVVAMEVNTGRVLAIASAPSLPLSDFIGGISQEVWDKLVNDPRHPLLDKSIQGQYPPGSTYKIVTAMAGLMEGASPRTRCFTVRAPQARQPVYSAAGRERGTAPSISTGPWRSPAMSTFTTSASGLGSTGWRPMPEALAWEKKPASTWNMKKPAWYRPPTGNSINIRSLGRRGKPCRLPSARDSTWSLPLQACRMIAATANGGTLYRPQYIEQIVSRRRHGNQKIHSHR